MKKFWIVLSVCWLWTCSGGGDKATGPEEPPIVVNLTSLTGQAQKGPFNNGTSINVAELSNTLSPTGRNFSSAITDNTGRFSVANVQLESPFVELRATGFYFNEVSNNISDAQLTLYALSDLTNKSSLNVNILTHLEKNRMQVLMSGDNPKTFAQAKLQAQEEVLAIFDYSRANMPASELLDISQGGAANAKLLAISAILQGDQTVGQMSELLANISTDLSADGTLDDSNLQSQLITNTQGLDFAEIRSNLSARFTALGITATIPDFETEINQFLKPPVAQDMSASTGEDTPINITLAASDPEDESLTYTILEVNNATVTLNGNVANYTPDAHFNGTDTFTFYANDGTSDSNIATVTMTVSAEDDDPNTQNAAATTDEDVAVVLQLTAEEYDGDSYSFAIVTDVSNGTTSLNGSTVTYTPNQDFNGEDTFTFEATDDTGRTINVATATITVNAVNDAPVANDITNQVTDENRMMQLDITLDATDVDGDALTYNITSTNNGSVTINDNIATYVPTQDWNGEDTFTYIANDGSVDSNTATVSITVNSVDDAPITLNSEMTIDEDSLDGEFTKITDYATDADGDDLIFIITELPTNGQLCQNAGATCGTVLAVGDTVTGENGIENSNPFYMPNENFHGSDSFSWKANDGFLDSNISTVSITVNSINDLPLAYPISIDMNEDEDITIDLIAIDPDGNSINSGQYSFATSPSNSNYIWGSAAHYFDIQAVTVPEDNSYVDIKFNNPLGSGDGDLELRFAYNAAEWSHVSSSYDDEWVGLDDFDRKQNVIDHMMKYLSVYPWVDTHDEFKTLFTNTVNSLYPMKVYWSPAENINGTETWSYVLSDSESTSDAATISVNINPVNDRPIAYDFSKSVDKNSEITFALRETSPGSNTGTDNEGGVYDPDIETGQDDDITFTLMSQPSNGTAELISNNDIKYTPNTGFVGTDTFTYRGNDGELDSNTATITINVNGVDITYPTKDMHYFTPEQDYDITWDGYLDDVSIALFKDGSKILDIAENLGSVNSYNWTVPSDLTFSDDYKVKIYPADDINSSLADMSENNFTINPLITVQMSLNLGDYNIDGFGLLEKNNEGFYLFGGISGNNATDMYLDEYDSSGNQIFRNVWGNSNFGKYDGINNIQFDLSGDIIGAGYRDNDDSKREIYWFKASASSGQVLDEGSYAWNGHPNYNDIGHDIVDTGNSFLVAAHLDTFGSRQDDAGILVLDSDMNLQQVIELEGTIDGFDGNQIPRSMIPLSDGNYLTCIRENPSGAQTFSNILLIKTDSQGQEIWRNSIQTSYSQLTNFNLSFKELSDGSFITTFDMLDGDRRKAGIILIDSSGNEIDLKAFSNQTSDLMPLHVFLRDLIVANDGGYYAIGLNKPRDDDDNFDNAVWLIKLNSSLEVESQAIFDSRIIAGVSPGLRYEGSDLVFYAHVRNGSDRILKRILVEVE